MRQESSDQVRAALAALPSRDCEVQMMRHLEQFSTATIAEAFGVGTVESRVIRALIRVRGRLEADA